MKNFESQRGSESELIVYKNYLYVVLRKNENSIRWKCTKNTYFKCPGKVTTNLIKPVSYYIIIYFYLCIYGNNLNSSA